MAVLFRATRKRSLATVLSVNVGTARASEHTDVAVTGIDKRPVRRPVEVRAPARRGIGGSGVVGDAVCDLRHHGGPDQAVYAYAREDLDWWQRELGRPLSNGVFGENLTTAGIVINDAVIGEHWRVGTAVLEISVPRIPCRTFAGWLDERGWVKRFTARAVPGSYLRVLRSGVISAGDEITVLARPDHDVTVGLTFRALTNEPELLSRLLVADALPADVHETARRRSPTPLDLD
ncbi:MAG: MOSC domain-containing protein [Sciscionella sp.]|nr:MOSC domain-containing protein [Sciscionella sp.]